MPDSSVEVYDTFAEAWTLEVSRVLITAMTTELAMGAAHQFAGAAGSSMIGSPLNAGIERAAAPHETPDHRPGVFVSLAHIPESREALLREIELRVALASLVPTVALFNAMIPGLAVETVDLHDKFAMSQTRWAGKDGERLVAGRRMCVTPTTTGEFLYEKELQISANGTDGHFVCFAANAASAVAAILAAKDALTAVDGVAPMGYGLEQVYREFDYIPSLRTQIPESKVPEGVGSVLNLLMFGASADLMARAMGLSLQAAAQAPGVLALTAMNFGGEFGKHRYYLRQVMPPGGRN